MVLLGNRSLSKWCSSLKSPYGAVLVSMYIELLKNLYNNPVEYGNLFKVNQALT